MSFRNLKIHITGIVLLHGILQCKSSQVHRCCPVIVYRYTDLVQNAMVKSGGGKYAVVKSHQRQIRSTEKRVFCVPPVVRLKAKAGVALLLARILHNTEVGINMTQNIFPLSPAPNSFGYAQCRHFEAHNLFLNNYAFVVFSSLYRRVIENSGHFMGISWNLGELATFLEMSFLQSGTRAKQVSSHSSTAFNDIPVILLLH